MHNPPCFRHPISERGNPMFIILIRAAILYTVVIFSIRLMGKRQLGEIQPSELAITILISNIATLSLEDIGIPLLRGILPILALVCFEVLSSWASLRFVGFRRLVSGSPKIIIREGNLDQEMLRSLRFSVDDLMTALRANGVFRITDVQFAIVETNGSVSVYQKQAVQPAEKQDVHVRKQDNDPPQVIAAEGKLRQKALAAAGKNESWLNAVLAKQNITVEDIYLMTADKDNSVYIIPKKEGSRRT